MGFLYTNLSGALISNTTTETSLIPPGGGTLVIPAGGLVVGSILRITAGGEWRTAAAATPTLRIRVKMAGGATVVVLDTAAVTTVTTTTLRPWWLEVFMALYNTGAFGVLGTRGSFRLNTTGILSADWDMAGGTPVIDTTVANTLGVTAQWGTADLNNRIACDVFALEMSGA